MLQKLHYHYYPNRNVDLGYTQNSQILNLESISMHMSFYNVSARLGNNLLFYNLAQPAIVLTDGYYDLDSFNKYLFINLYKIVLDYDSQHYGVYHYTSQADWANQINGVEQLVGSASALNISIFNGMFFANIIKLQCNLFESGTTIESSNQLDVHDMIEFPVTAPKMSFGTIYFTPPVQYALNSKTVLSLGFLDY